MPIGASTGEFFTLKSNMDRFIDGLDVGNLHVEDALKSNMDRFIDFT